MRKLMTAAETREATLAYQDSQAEKWHEELAELIMGRTREGHTSLLVGDHRLTPSIIAPLESLGYVIEATQTYAVSKISW